ncbi:hypothetical protein QP411_06560 [Pseudoglutamicibacter cumminsii]|uniref:hypothetical protein n=1 Tax=Pseudoglutamicibacter cumminsii TaxID=156979 RepID=UPI00255473CA|nr:hypothetical protein [Pseudoglutamicibacter cumminsii]MDK7083574.1 hypothetical protein [Pseudoglutamicibacter cumminsii]
MNKSTASKMILGLALASSIGLAGCSVGVSDEGQDQSANQASAQQSTQGDNATTEDQAQTTSGDSTATDSTASEDAADQDNDSGQGSDSGEMDNREPILTVTTGVTVEGDKDAKLTIDMLEAKREGKFVKVVYGYTLHTTAEDDNKLNLWKVAGQQHLVTEYAIDQKNLNKHKRLNTGALTNQGVHLTPGKRTYATSVFAAPPEDVHKMDFNLWNSVEMAQGVEID